MYLPEEVVRATLAKVVGLEKGSCIGFDYHNDSLVLDPKHQKNMKRMGEPWLFGLNDGEPEVLVESEQLHMLDHLRYKELLDRYVPKHYD